MTLYKLERKKLDSFKAPRWVAILVCISFRESDNAEGFLQIPSSLSANLARSLLWLIYWHSNIGWLQQEFSTKGNFQADSWISFLEFVFQASHAHFETSPSAWWCFALAFYCLSSLISKLIDSIGGIFRLELNHKPELMVIIATMYLFMWCCISVQKLIRNFSSN